MPVAALLLLAILLHAIRYDTSLSTLVTCRQFYKNEQWDALLQEVKKRPSDHLDLQFMTNFALCKKRRLLDEHEPSHPWSITDTGTACVGGMRGAARRMQPCA
jgi:hypothetical protein